MFSRLSRKGFSLVELMIVVAIVAILFVPFLGAAGGCVTTEDRKADGERNANAFAAGMGLEITGASCSGADSDGDGYASCTLAMVGGTTRAIECGYDRPFALLGQNEGCRMAMPGNFIQQ